MIGLTLISFSLLFPDPVRTGNHYPHFIIQALTNHKYNHSATNNHTMLAMIPGHISLPEKYRKTISKCLTNAYIRNIYYCPLRLSTCLKTDF